MHTSGYVSSYVCARTMKWITWETKQVIKKKKKKTPVSAQVSRALAPPWSSFLCVLSAAELLSTLFAGLVTKRRVAIVTERSCRSRQRCHLGSGAVPSVVQVRNGFVLIKVPRGRAFFSHRRTFVRFLIVARTRKCSERGRLCKDKQGGL